MFPALIWNGLPLFLIVLYFLLFFVSFFFLLYFKIIITLLFVSSLPRRSGALTFCLENQEIIWGIQMERFIPEESFWKKNNTFRGITFSPFLPKRPKFSVPLVWITYYDTHKVILRKFPGVIQPRPQGFSLKKWVGREKALASAGHVSPRTP